MKEEKSGKGITLFFLTVMIIFTTINLMEFLGKTEADGRFLGLNQLETVKEDAITLWGGLQRLMGKDLAFGSTTYEDVTLLESGYATMADGNPLYQAAVTGALEAEAFAEEIGAEFLYVQVPGKSLGIEDYPAGIICYSAMKHTEVVAQLRTAGIDVLDMREVLLNSGEEWLSYFYYSDHHWNNDAAFLAYQNICGYMREKGVSIQEEYLTEDAYEQILYEDIFLGTHGRMAGPLYTGLDDYELWLPLFTTDFTLEVASQGIYLEGDFEECFVHYENLAEYSYDYYAYYAYLKEDYDLFEIVNRGNEAGPHVVIVRDSSAVPVSVFLASQCSELDIIDLRYTSDNGVLDYVRQQDPDFIIYLFGTGYLGDENAMIMR